MGKYGNGKMWAMFKQLSSKYGTVLQQQCSCTTVILFYGGSAESFFKRVHFFCNGKFAPFLTLATSCVRRQSPLAISLIARKTLWSEEKNSSFSLPLVSFVLCALHTMNYNRVSKQDGCLSSVVLRKKKLSYSVQEPNCEVDVFWLQHPTE